MAIVAQRPVRPRRPSGFEKVLSVISTGVGAASTGVNIVRGIHDLNEQKRERSRNQAKEMILQDYNTMINEQRDSAVRDQKEDLLGQAQQIEGTNQVLRDMPFSIADPIVQFNALLADGLINRASMLEPGSVHLEGPLTMRAWTGDRKERMRQLVATFLDIPMESVTDDTRIDDLIFPEIVDQAKVDFFMKNPDAMDVAASHAAAAAIGADGSFEGVQREFYEESVLLGEIRDGLASPVNRDGVTQMLFRKAYGQAFTNEWPTDIDGVPSTVPVPWDDFGNTIMSHDLVMQRLMVGEGEEAMKMRVAALWEQAKKFQDNTSFGVSLDQAFLLVQGKVPENATPDQRQNMEMWATLLPKARLIGYNLAMIEGSPFVAQMKNMEQLLTSIGAEETFFSDIDTYDKVVGEIIPAMNGVAGVDGFPSWFQLDGRGQFIDFFLDARAAIDLNILSGGDPNDPGIPDVDPETGVRPVPETEAGLSRILNGQVILWRAAPEDGEFNKAFYIKEAAELGIWTADELAEAFSTAPSRGPIGGQGTPGVPPTGIPTAGTVQQ